MIFDCLFLGSLITVLTGARPPRFVGPALAVVIGKMKNLAETDRRVAVVFKMRVQRDCLRRLLVSPSRVADKTTWCGTKTGHQRGAAGTACRHHAIGTLEQHAALGQGVEVGCFHELLAETGQLRTQIIDGNEQQIRPHGGVWRVGPAGRQK